MCIERFYKQRAVNIAVLGSYSLPNWHDPEGNLRTFECSTVRLSPFQMLVEAPVVGRVGDRITSYFSEFGELDGSISDTRQDSFLLELELTRMRRTWMAEKLAWVEKRQKDCSLLDVREDARFVPPTSHSTLILADGTVQRCLIIDVSCSGVAVLAEYDPPIGTPLAIGSCVGRVVRRFPNGFAVKFVERQNRDDLTRLILRTLQNSDRPSHPAQSSGARSAG